MTCGSRIFSVCAVLTLNGNFCVVQLNTVCRISHTTLGQPNLLLFRFLTTTIIGELKILWLLFCSLAVIASSNAQQSAQDHWDSLFHPRALQQGLQQRHPRCLT